MKQQLKSLQSKDAILQAGLELFSSCGYRATTLKEIAREAGISTGRVYHHFHNKLHIFTCLLDRYWAYLKSPELKLNHLSRAARFPDDFHQIAEAIREIVTDKKAYINLIYVDVIEFKGEHIQRFYTSMAERFKATYGPSFEEMKRKGLFNPEADPLFAVMMTFRFFFNYFLVETSFGVLDHFGLNTNQVVEQARQLILHGLLAPTGRSQVP